MAEFAMLWLVKPRKKKPPAMQTQAPLTQQSPAASAAAGLLLNEVNAASERSLSLSTAGVAALHARTLTPKGSSRHSSHSGSGRRLAASHSEPSISGGGAGHAAPPAAQDSVFDPNSVSRHARWGARTPTGGFYSFSPSGIASYR
eukprot:TRINITY_DN84652_c0_g1_i1.p2 TRINITY_DN84652_c0_g1~~TRINITY_DN84652_c0_g1_i1.p2  ORF type:complete len:145 (-),score=24.08 TRINITY_DN84652_c0_g1_i1:308-742(-)